MHILFAREHNRIADILGGLNPRWSDDVIFFETKRIVEAEFQHITYNEWLPQVIGTETMQRFGLNIRETGYSNDYNPDVNACITSEFSTAAQRFGHSTVDGKFLYVFLFSLFFSYIYNIQIGKYCSIYAMMCQNSTFTLHFFFSSQILLLFHVSVQKGNGEDEVIEIPDVFFNTNRLRQRNFYDEILLTLTRQPLQQVDSAVTQGVSLFCFLVYFFYFRFLLSFPRTLFITRNICNNSQLSKFLFRGSNPFGLDLASINVLRGRDHGIRAYNEYVEVTGHRKVSSFDEFGPGVSLFLCLKSSEKFSIVSAKLELCFIFIKRFLRNWLLCIKVRMTLICGSVV